MAPENCKCVSGKLLSLCNCFCVLVMAFPHLSTLDPDSQLVNPIGFYKFYQSTFIGVMYVNLLYINVQLVYDILSINTSPYCTTMASVFNWQA